MGRHTAVVPYAWLKLQDNSKLLPDHNTIKMKRKVR